MAVWYLVLLRGRPRAILFSRRESSSASYLRVPFHLFVFPIISPHSLTLVAAAAAAARLLLSIPGLEHRYS